MGDNTLRRDEMKNQIWPKAYFQQSQRPSIKIKTAPRDGASRAALLHGGP